MFTESRDIDTPGQRVSHTYEELRPCPGGRGQTDAWWENIYYGSHDNVGYPPEAAQELDKLVRLQ